MQIEIEPTESKLGIKQEIHEFFVNDNGKLNVIFRYDRNQLVKFQSGYQVQFETISPNETRGNHYHYPEFAGEEFFLVSGYAALIVSNLDSSLIEIYFLNKKTTYFVPALIAHKVQNIGYLLDKGEDVELIISKHYNNQVGNLQKPFVISSEITDNYLIHLLRTVKNELQS
jgi:oxalate decarboxylase/phosphoglucose isomerase-like protein (cupin superfamily)